MPGQDRSLCWLCSSKFLQRKHGKYCQACEEIFCRIGEERIPQEMHAALRGCPERQQRINEHRERVQRELAEQKERTAKARLT